MIHFIGGKGRLHKGTVLNLRSCMRKRDTLKNRQEPPGQAVACIKTAKTALHHEYRKELYAIFLLTGRTCVWFISVPNYVPAPTCWQT